MNSEERNKIIKWAFVIIGIIAVYIICSLIVNSLFYKHTEGLVYVTRTGDCYHSIGCGYLRSMIPKGIEVAKAQGYRACSACGGIPHGTIEVNDYWTSFTITFGILFLAAFCIFLLVVYIKDKNQKVENSYTKQTPNNFKTNTTTNLEISRQEPEHIKHNTLTKNNPYIQTKTETASSGHKINWVRVQSSNIQQVYYNIDIKSLYIMFKSGGIYVYYDVEMSVFTEFLTAPSKGVYVRTELYKYKYKRVNVDEIK